MKVARDRIGQFRGRQHVGHPRSEEYVSADRLFPLGHWLMYVERKGNCVVCQAIMKRKKLPTKANRHDCM